MKKLAPLPVLLCLLVAGTSVPAFSQSVSGTAFEDRNGNGILDPGEPVLPGIPVRLVGVQDAGPAVDVEPHHRWIERRRGETTEGGEGDGVESATD